MPNEAYDDLLELARLCELLAKAAPTESLSTNLLHMAKRQQQRASELDEDRLPSIESNGG